MPLFGVGHPIGALHLLRRFVSRWRHITESIQDTSSLAKVSILLQDSSDVLPQRDDVTGALESLLRLQKVYKLDMNDMADGYIQGSKTAPMTGNAHVPIARGNTIWYNL